MPNREGQHSLNGSGAGLWKAPLHSFVGVKGAASAVHWASSGFVTAGSMVAGVPGKFRRPLLDNEIDGIRTNATLYQELVKLHRDAGAEQR